MVCAGEISLEQAQHVMAANWLKAWKQYVRIYQKYGLPTRVQLCVTEDYHCTNRVHGLRLCGRTRAITKGNTWIEVVLWLCFTVTQIVLYHWQLAAGNLAR